MSTLPSLQFAICFLEGIARLEISGPSGQGVRSITNVKHADVKEARPVWKRQLSTWCWTDRVELAAVTLQLLSLSSVVFSTAAATLTRDIR